MEVVKLESIDIEQTRNALVVKHNDLIEARYQAFTIVEQRIILMLLGQIQKNDTDFKKYRVSVADFCRLTGLELNGGFYEHLRKTLTGLTSKSIYIKKEDGFLVTTWFSDAEYKKSEGWIEISISSKLKPYLLDLKAKYTQYQLDIAIHFKSQYAIRLYERLKKEAQIVKEYKHKDSFNQKYSYEDLREFFVVEKKLYSMFKDFRKWVIEPAVKEVSDKSDLNIMQVEYIKTGRKITHVCFSVVIRSREEANARTENLRLEDMPTEEPNEEENHPIIDSLINLGFTFENARSCKNKYGVRRIERNISYVQGVEKTSKKPIERLPAYLFQAIQEDWGKATEDKKEREQAKRKQEQEAKEREEQENERIKAEQRKQTEQAVNAFSGLPVGLKNHIQEEFLKVLKSEKRYFHLVPKWEVLKNEKEALIVEPMLGYVFAKFLSEKRFI